MGILKIKIKILKIMKNIKIIKILKLKIRMKKK
jgi:hypothetical protein